MASQEAGPATTQEKDLDDTPAVKVEAKIPHSLDTQGQAADYGGWSAYKLAGTEQAQIILPFDSYRHRATVKVNGPSEAGEASAAAQGATGANPTTGTAVATIAASSLPAGTYSVTVQTYMDGTTPGASDDDNMGLHRGAASVTHLNSPGVADSPVTSGPFVLTVNGTQTISVVVLNTVATGAVYHASIVATPVAGGASPGFVYLGTQAQCQQQLGGILACGERITIENNQALWMAPDGTDPVTVSVLAERWDSGT